MKRVVSMFGMTSSKELCLRARQQGVPVSDEFIAAWGRQPMNETAFALEVTYRIRVAGETVLPPEVWYQWPSEGPVKLQSTIQPDAFVTVPVGNSDLVNDMCESGLYRVWFRK